MNKNEVLEELKERHKSLKKMMDEESKDEPLWLRLKARRDELDRTIKIIEDLLDE